MNNVINKLMKIQTELKVPKNQKNTFGGYNFRNCEDIMEASKPVCSKYNCVLTCSDELINIGDRYYIQATATLYDIDSGESIKTTSEAREEEIKKGMDASQITGSASSYARKYALNGLLQLDDNKDADTNEYQKQAKTNENKNLLKKNQAKDESITDEQVKLLHVMLGKAEKSQQQLFKRVSNDKVKETYYQKYGVTTSKELTKKQATEMIDTLKKVLGEV